MKNTKDKKKKKVKLSQIIMMLGFLLIGAFCGYWMGTYIGELISGGEDAGDALLRGLILFIGMYAAMFVQIILHEGGHLIFGLLTGYGFASFRVGSLMWKNENGKLKFCRFSLAGTGGQCLMTPPEMVDGKMPYVLYNLGGSLVNLISAVLFGLLYLLCRDMPMVSILFMMLAVIGVAFALMNGIPLGGVVNNDGHNAISIGKDPESMRAFWLQMKVNELTSAGVRLKDMPEEWFVLPSEESMKNSMVATVGVFTCSRKIDAMEFEAADELMEKILTMDGVIDIYRKLLTMERIYCELIGECRREIVEKWLDKDLKRFMKAMKTNPSVIRAEYALAVLLDRDRERAETCLAAFEKVAKTHPHPVDIEGERELIAYVDQLDAARCI
ncbi:MAG: hypothetical protein IJZ85_12145 [Lachnospiraceae bacterium]|nr:hypothetical protein [Lachnospiraceae bacterium]